MREKAFYPEDIIFYIIMLSVYLYFLIGGIILYKNDYPKNRDKKIVNTRKDWYDKITLNKYGEIRLIFYLTFPNSILIILLLGSLYQSINKGGKK